MIVKAIKSISVGVLIQLGFGLAVQGMAQAYCPGPQDSSHCLQQRQQEQERQLQRLQNEAWKRDFKARYGIN